MSSHRKKETAASAINSHEAETTARESFEYRLQEKAKGFDRTTEKASDTDQDTFINCRREAERIDEASLAAARAGFESRLREKASGAFERTTETTTDTNEHFTNASPERTDIPSHSVARKGRASSWRETPVDVEETPEVAADEAGKYPCLEDTTELSEDEPPDAKAGGCHFATSCLRETLVVSSERLEIEANDNRDESSSKCSDDLIGREVSGNGDREGSEGYLREKGICSKPPEVTCGHREDAMRSNVEAEKHDREAFDQSRWTARQSSLSGNDDSAQKEARDRIGEGGTEGHDEGEASLDYVILSQRPQEGDLENVQSPGAHRIRGPDWRGSLAESANITPMEPNTCTPIESVQSPPLDASLPIDAFLVEPHNQSTGGGNEESRRMRTTPVSPLVSSLAVKILPMPDDENQKRRTGIFKEMPRSRRRRLIIGILILVVLLSTIAVAVPLALRSSSSEPAEQSDDPQNATSYDPPVVYSKRFNLMKSIVSAVSDDNLFLDEMSPQFKALAWLADEDARNLTLDDIAAVIQRYIMAVLFYSTGGRNAWISDYGFLSSRHECEWNRGIENLLHNPSIYGVFCSSDDDVVQGVGLASNNLTGLLPDEFGWLTDLRLVSLYDNHLRRSVPESFSNLTKICGLNLGENDLSGDLSWLCGLSNIKKIGVQENSFSGSLPDCIGELLHLTDFSAYSNHLRGHIPSIPTNVRNFAVFQNLLTGTLPKSLTRINNFLAWCNQLSGTLPFPEEIGSLATPNIASIMLEDNNINGSLPVTLGDLSNLKLLSLRGNKVVGGIPTTMGQLEKLKLLDIGRNSLTGPIPSSLWDLQSMIVLSLASNKLSGSISASVANMKGIVSLSLYSNQLSGTVPSELGGLRQLRVLELANNTLGGTLPRSFMSLENLEWLTLQKNNLTGNLTFICGSDTVMLTAADCGGSSLIDCKCCCCYSGSHTCDLYIDFKSMLEYCESGHIDECDDIMDEMSDSYTDDFGSLLHCI